MIEKILFATDLGALTMQSLIHVETLADTFEARIDIVHAVNPIGGFAEAVIKSHFSDATQSEVLDASHMRNLLNTVRDEIFEVLAADQQDDIQLISRVNQIIVEPGQPAAVILEQAEKLSSDLIVVGSHSTDAIDASVLGSVAGKVLQLARVPVYLIPLVNTVSQVQGIAPSGKHI